MTQDLSCIHTIKTLRLSHGNQYVDVKQYRTDNIFSKSAKLSTFYQNIKKSLRLTKDPFSKNVETLLCFTVKCVCDIVMYK